jgi:hypothetical protein
MFFYVGKKQKSEEKKERNESIKACRKKNILFNLRMTLTGCFILEKNFFETFFFLLDMRLELIRR